MKAFLSNSHFCPVVSPPLRERPEDIPLLIEWMLNDMELGTSYVFSNDALWQLTHYLWPGNARQLRNVLSRVIALRDPSEDDSPFIKAAELNLPGMEQDDVALRDDVPPPVRAQTPARPLSVGLTEPQQSPTHYLHHYDSLKECMESNERAAIEEVLEETEWNITQSAQLLGISKVWLYKRIKKYGLRDLRPS